MKEKIKKEYIRRTRKLLETKLSSRNSNIVFLELSSNFCYQI